MGKSRNQRSKQEGTFLEHVQCLIEKLQADVTHIKLRLNHGAFYSSSCRDQQYIPNVWETTDTANIDSLVDPACNVEALLSWFEFPNGEHPQRHTWNTSAGEFLPPQPVTPVPLCKTTILNHRFNTAGEVPDQTASLSTAFVGTAADNPGASKIHEDSLRGDFRSLPVEAWDRIHEKFGSEANSVDEDNMICKHCKEWIDPCTDDTVCEGSLTGDSCDKCCSLHHSACLTVAGEWHICSVCAAGPWSHLLEPVTIGRHAK